MRSNVSAGESAYVSNSVVAALRPIIRSHIFWWGIAVCIALSSTSCSSSPTGGNKSSTEQASTKPAAKPADLETGRMVLQRLYTTSRGWAPDTEPIRIESQNYKHSGSDAASAPTGQDGKSALWRAIFGSPSRHLMKTYMWSGLTGPDVTPGITPGSEDSFSGGNSSTQPFQWAYLKTDSDQALQTAQKHGGAAQLKKDPNLPVNYSLQWNPHQSVLEWHVLYGNSTNQPDLSVVVDATTGKFVRVEK
jgi:hypothetical protein